MIPLTYSLDKTMQKHFVTITDNGRTINDSDDDAQKKLVCNRKKNTVEKVFNERKEFLVLGLTGLKGSGCTTVCKFLNSNFRSLSLENVSSPQGAAKDDEYRDKRILRIFAAHNWEPFDVIKGRDIILSFALEYWDEFVKIIKLNYYNEHDSTDIDPNNLFESKIEDFLKDLSAKVTKLNEISKQMHDAVEEAYLKNYSGRCFYDVKLCGILQKFYDEIKKAFENKTNGTNGKHKFLQLIECLSSMNNSLIGYWEGKNVSEDRRSQQQIPETTETENLHKKNYIYVHIILPLFGNFIYSAIDNKSLLTKIFQQLGNRIRYYGSIYEGNSSNIDFNKSIYSFPIRINSFIKVLRHPMSRIENARVYVVIDSLKNVYEAKYLRSRYSAFYLIAITRDEDIRVQGLEKKRIFGDDLRQIDFNERPSEARKQFKKFLQTFMESPQSYNSREECLINEVEGDNYCKILAEIRQKTKGAPEYLPYINALYDKVRVRAYINNLQQFFLQDVESCIQDADIFIANNEQDGGKRKLKFSIIRYISLMQHPGLVLPTPIERCMQIAYTAKANSGCISRQVGAVATDLNYRILSIGWNDVPCGQTSCIRRSVIDLHRYHDLEAYSKFERSKESDFRKNYLDRFKFSDEKKLIDAFRGLPVAYCFKDAYQEITGERNQVHTRSMHGEEKALLYCNQELIKGGYLFTTSSPCELCSKNAKEHFIKIIYYIEPYPGISQSHICDSGDEENQAKYELFQGAIGRAYTQLFTPLMPYKDELALRGFPDSFRE